MMKHKSKKISRARKMELNRAKENMEASRPRIGISRVMYEAIKKQGGFRL